MPNQLTPVKKTQTVNAVIAFQRDHGYQPSLQDIADMLGISKNTAWNRLLHLRDEGRVTWEPGQARTLRVIWKDN